MLTNFQFKNFQGYEIRHNEVVRALLNTIMDVRIPNVEENSRIPQGLLAPQEGFCSVGLWYLIYWPKDLVQWFLWWGRCKSVSLHTVEGSTLQVHINAFSLQKHIKGRSGLSQTMIMLFACWLHHAGKTEELSIFLANMCTKCNKVSQRNWVKCSHDHCPVACDFKRYPKYLRYKFHCLLFSQINHLITDVKC